MWRIVFSSIQRIHFFIFILLFSIPFPSHGQLHKIWELTMPANGVNPLSFNINQNVSLRSFRTRNGDHIVISNIVNGLNTKHRSIYLFRFNTDGHIVWEYTYPSPYQIGEFGYDVTMDSVENIIIGGKTITKDFGGVEPTEYSNAILLKISPEGQLMWMRESAPAPNNIQRTQLSSAVASDQDGNIYTTMLLVSANGYRPILQRWTPEGQLVWEKELEKYFGAGVTIKDSMLVVIFSDNPSYIYHYSFEGELLFSRKLDLAISTKPVFDDEGAWYNFSITDKYRIEKTALNGDSLWGYQLSKNHLPTISEDEITDCCVDNDGNTYVTGRYYGVLSSDSSIFVCSDIVTMKFDHQGQVVWKNVYGSYVPKSCKTGQRILQDQHGNTYVAGFESVEIANNPVASFRMVLLVYDPFGNRIDSVYYDDIVESREYGVNMILDPDAIYLLGWAQQSDGLFDQFVIKYSTLPTSIQQEGVGKIFRIYPNPIHENQFVICSDQKILPLRIYDSTGKLRYENTQYQANSMVHLTSNFIPGLYFVSLKTTKGISTQPVIIL